MQRLTVAILATAVSFVATAQVATTADSPVEPWIARSNSYTSQLLDVQLRHSPEQGSREGVAKFDERISNPKIGRAHV